MSEQFPTGAVGGVPVLDLTPVESADGLSAITGIDKVAVVLVREALVPALQRIPMRAVATIVPIPDGARVRVHTGAMVVAGEALDAPGAEGDVLVVIGSMILTTPVRRVSFQEVVVVGMVLAPEGSEAALLAGLGRVTGAVHHFRYQEGYRIRVLQGHQRLSGRALAEPGDDPEDMLLVTGQLVVTSPVPRLGWRHVTVLGQLIAPRESEVVLAPVETHGQVVWYGGAVRLGTGSDRFGAAFLELLDDDTTLVLAGSFTFEPGITAELLRRKIGSIVIAGKLAAPGELVPVLQLLAIERQGAIVALDDPAGTDAL